MMEKNQMLDQLYNTLKQLKQQFEASRQVRAALCTCALQCCLSAPIDSSHLAAVMSERCQQPASLRSSHSGVELRCVLVSAASDPHNVRMSEPRFRGVCLQEAAEATQGLQQAQGQAQQHLAAIQEANKLQEGASAALVSLSLRCEGLAETTAAQSAARQVGQRLPSL